MDITTGTAVVFRASFLKRLSDKVVGSFAQRVLTVMEVRELQIHTAPSSRTKKSGKWFTKREVRVIFELNGEICEEWYPLSAVKIAR